LISGTAKKLADKFFGAKSESNLKFSPIALAIEPLVASKSVIRKQIRFATNSIRE